MRDSNPLSKQEQRVNESHLILLEKRSFLQQKFHSMYCVQGANKQGCSVSFRILFQNYLQAILNDILQH